MTLKTDQAANKKCNAQLSLNADKGAYVIGLQT